MIEVDSELVVFLKDADLIASTAFLTLTGKMGYSGKLLGLKRFDFFRFTLGCKDSDDPENALSRLISVLSAQSTFFNRNKHHFFLECRWAGKVKRFGTDLAVAQRGLRADIMKSLGKGGANLDIQSGSKRVILEGDSVLVAEFLVQERESEERVALSNKLSAEMAGYPVEFKDKGVLWWLAVRGRDEAEISAFVDEIAVTVKRGRGLLLNPNYQDYRMLAIRKMCFD
jgi:hypothetical protein